MTTYTLNLNGESVNVEAEPGTPLLYVLRGDLDTVSVRYGCGQEQCGACKVLVDGRPTFACTTPVEAVTGHITTVEGLGSEDELHPLQQAFLAFNAAQCGYCSSGILISAAALLAENRSPTRADIQQALEGHLCRCGAHNRVIRAVLRAAEQLRRSP